MNAKKEKQFRLGVSGKMILNFAVPTALILIILAAIVTVTVINTVQGLKVKNIDDQLESVSLEVNQYFSSFFTNEQLVLNETSVQQLFAELERSPANYRFETSATYEQAMQSLQNADNIWRCGFGDLDCRHQKQSSCPVRWLCLGCVIRRNQPCLVR